MVIYFELLLIAGVGYGVTWFGALIFGMVDPDTKIGISGVFPKEDLTYHYELRKSKFLFIPSLIMGWKLKSGRLLKVTFWEMISVYVYYVLFLIGSLVVFAITGGGITEMNANDMNILIFIILLIFPVLTIPLVVPILHKKYSSFFKKNSTK